MKKRLEELKKDQKGFTLVELIVVLVILAILAALLVPALLGYIDRARNAKYLEEARSIYTAIQAVQDENYAKGSNPLVDNVTFTAGDAVNNLVTPTVVSSVTITNRTTTGTKQKEDYVVKKLDNLLFQSQDNNNIKANMADDGTWSVAIQ